LKALDSIDVLQGIVEAFYASEKRYPQSWRDLKTLGGIPVDPERVPFVLDPVAHRVSLSPESPLWPLPTLPSK
jgi:hypothetical protein